jgi:hypothetical protein
VSLEYPDRSPALGRLIVSFGWDEITIFVGPRGFHAHFGPDDAESGSEDERTRQAAAEALGFIRDLVEDRIVMRWGLLVSGVHSPQARPTLLGRAWRRITPWVREAVWSGRR